MAPDPNILLSALELEFPLIALYDAPGNELFQPVITPAPRGRECLFAYFKKWLEGHTLQLTKEHFGCGGCGKWLFNVSGRKRMEYLDFLVDQEGLRASHELMGKWFDQSVSHVPRNEYILIGPAKDAAYDFLQSITFFVNPDQLSILITGAYYHHDPSDPSPVLAPFGSGCMELLPLFEDRTLPQAIIGATDMAMRQYIPANILAFTVTKGMYERLCSLDERSFLFKPFLKKMKQSRKRSVR
jgi:hypothetical protein